MPRLLSAQELGLVGHRGNAPTLSMFEEHRAGIVDRSIDFVAGAACTLPDAELRARRQLANLMGRGYSLRDQNPDDWTHRR